MTLPQCRCGPCPLAHLSTVSRETVSSELGILILLSLGNQELVAAATCHVLSTILGAHLWHELSTAQEVGAQLGRHLPPASLLAMHRPHRNN